jgi:hypothetical protein
MFCNYAKHDGSHQLITALPRRCVAQYVRSHADVISLEQADLLLEQPFLAGTADFA